MYEYELASPQSDTFGRSKNTRSQPLHLYQCSNSLDLPIAQNNPPHAIVLLSPSAQPTVVWPFQSVLECASSQNRALYLQPQPFSPVQAVSDLHVALNDPLASHRRFPNSLPALQIPVSMQTPVYEPRSWQAPFFGPEEFPRRNYNVRKTLWRPRSHNKQALRDQRQANTTYAQEDGNISSRPISGLCSCEKLFPEKSTNSSDSIYSSVPLNKHALSHTLTPISNETDDDDDGPEPAKAECFAHTFESPTSELLSLDSKPVLPSRGQNVSSSIRFSTPGTQKRRRKQAKIESSTSNCSLAKYWTLVTWKKSRWLLSHEKAVVRLLLCLLLLGVFVLAMQIESKSKEVVVEADNWSRAKYNWIDELSI